MSVPSKAAAVFDAEAARYDAAYGAPGPGGHALRARLAAVLRLVGDGPGDALDVGMGPGRLCAALAARGWTVSGVDSSPRMVEHARKRLPDRTEALRTGRAEELPFPAGSFDMVTATGVLEFADDLERALRELARVVREDGLVVVSFPHYLLPYALFRRRLWYPTIRALKRFVSLSRPAPARHAHPLGRRRFATLLTRTGLEIRSFEYVSVQVVPRRLAELLEGRGPVTGRLLASQLVYSTRKIR